MSQRLRKLYDEAPKWYTHDANNTPFDKNGALGICIYRCLNCMQEEKLVLNPTTSRSPLFTNCPECSALSFVRMSKEGWAHLGRIYEPKRGELAFTNHTPYTALGQAELQHLRIYGDKAHLHKDKLQSLADSLYNEGRGVMLVAR